MLEAEYLIFCRDIQISPQGINITGSFEQIRALELPMKFPYVKVLVMLSVKKPLFGEDLNAVVKVEFKHKEVLKNNIVLKDAKAMLHQTIPIIIDFPDMVFQEAGDYYYKFYLNDKLLVTRILQVVPDNEDIGMSK